MKLTTLLNALNFDFGETHPICIYMRARQGTKCTSIDCVNCPLDGDDSEYFHILRKLPHEASDAAD